MYTKSATWVNKSATGAGSTAIIAPATTDPAQYSSIWVTGIEAEVIGLGGGELSRISPANNLVDHVFYTETNGRHSVDYQGTSGMISARYLGPASTGLYLTTTGSSNRTTVSVGYFLSKD